MRGDNEPNHRFRLVHFDKIELGAGDNYLVKGLVPREGLVVIWGPPKCGKTFWTFDLTMHIALGWEYRGRRVTEGTVVYVACEGERGLAARAEAFRIAKMSDSADAPAFFLLTTRLGLVSDVAVLVADIKAQIGTDGCAAIVIDTLNRSIEGSESDDRDMGDYVKAADTIREAFGCAVIIIHHCGIDGSRPRGHSSLTGAADAQIAVKRDGAGNVIATVEFMKDGAEGDEIVSAMKVIEVGKDGEGEPMTSCVIEASDATTSATGERKKIPAAAKQALAVLKDTLVSSPIANPGSNHVPKGVTNGVSKTLWRHMCEKAGIINPDGNPREQLRRIIVTLKDAGAIGVWDDFVWPVTRRHNVSQ